MKKPDKIDSVMQLLELMQSWLWYNDSYKLFFSKHRTNNPNQLYYFFLDTRTGSRGHGRYTVTTGAVLLTFLGHEFKVKHLHTMRRYDIMIVQFINVTNELDIINWVGTSIPTEKGTQYNIS